ncbi:hypothetical protein F2P56_009953 [Juglans regia]|uniref:3,9-dihydroxypterocarpan 6A-monooxygenase-like n=2 Tax=Juglans regia TaxID=51240 RepID=A0A2I4DN17_JUGRE|nr:3,9-dihydroxypterocarpan 6A-monooxygenase-like [Juglans regia]KAF5473335.1 hypothetical protein F2P56_009953 [Juglans regia]
MNSTMPDFQNCAILLICLASIWLIGFFFIRPRTKPRLPPSPQALPIIGHLHLLSRIPHQALHKLSNRHGTLIYLLFGSKPCVIVSSPEMARECLKTNEFCFLNSPKMANIDYLTYGSADFTMAPYGSYWKFMKKLCMTELLSGRTLEQHLPIRDQEIKRFLQLLLKKAKANEAVDVGAQLIRLTNNIISRMALRKRCSENEDESDEVRKLVEEMCELAGKANVSEMIWFCKNLDLQGFGKRLKDVRDRYDAMIERIMKEHEEARKKKETSVDGGDGIKDILDSLLDVYEDESSDIRMTRKNIKGFIMNMFGAGTDTSAVTTEWAMSELINHPDVMAKARQEIDMVIGKIKLVEESVIANLPYIQAIVKETLRLHPPGPLVVRECTEDCIIAGYEIPAKARLFVNVWAIGRDINHWENPLEFWPERFLNKEEMGKSQLDVRGQHFHLLPFGTGRRSCPGATLAMHVVQTTLAVMIQCFEWKVGDGGYGSVDMEEGPGVSLPRDHPLVSVPVARLSPFPLI